MSLTGTEIWDQNSNENEMNSGDKGSDWLENAADTKAASDSGWEEVGQPSYPGDDGGDGWDTWTTNTSKRTKVRIITLLSWSSKAVFQ